MSMPSDIRVFNRTVIEEFRANGGRLSDERLHGDRLVLLTTTGARTGREHTTPLAFFRDGPGRIFLWASAMAAPSHPVWYHNLSAEPRVAIELITDSGTVERFEGTATTARGTERDRLFAALKSAQPQITAHQDHTDREIPLVVVTYDPGKPVQGD